MKTFILGKRPKEGMEKMTIDEIKEIRDISIPYYQENAYDNDNMPALISEARYSQTDCAIYYNAVDQTFSIGSNYTNHKDSLECIKVAICEKWSIEDIIDGLTYNDEENAYYTKDGLKLDDDDLFDVEVDAEQYILESQIGIFYDCKDVEGYIKEQCDILIEEIQEEEFQEEVKNNDA